ncbi:MAG: hypothetical protein WA184_07065 [Stellaceae bacterium]
MNRHQIEELAAILVNEHGQRALAHARQRRSQYAQMPRSDAFRLWKSIAAATARLLRAHSHSRAGAR